VLAPGASPLGWNLRTRVFAPLLTVLFIMPPCAVPLLQEQWAGQPPHVKQMSSQERQQCPTCADTTDFIKDSMGLPSHFASGRQWHIASTPCWEIDSLPKRATRSSPHSPLIVGGRAASWQSGPLSKPQEGSNTVAVVLRK
jgi:hypothetical protein